MSFGDAIKANPGNLLNTTSAAAGSAASSFAAFDPITAGIKFGIGAIESIVGFNQQNEQARLQNERAMAQYKQQLKIRQRQIIAQDTAYNFKKQRYNTTLRNLSETAQAAYQQEDLRINELLKQARFARQGENIALQQSLGRRAASGMTGKSAARMQAMDMAAYGRNQAIRAEQLFTGEVASKMRRDKIQRDLTAARENAYADVAFAPTRPVMPLAPEQVEGPSAMGLIGNMFGVVGNAALGGFDAGRANKQLLVRNTLTDK